MFDRDDNKDHELQAALVYAQKQGYHIAYSNPSFEYWYLIHFEKRNGFIKDAASVIDILKRNGYLANYEKSVDVYDDLIAYQQIAIDRAKNRVEQLEKDNTAIISCDSNPVTTVYKLVEFLNNQRAGG